MTPLDTLTWALVVLGIMLLCSGVTAVVKHLWVAIAGIFSGNPPG